MTMIPTIVRADAYNMMISKGENDMFLFEYEEKYDINNQEHIKAFQNMEQIKNFHEQMLSAYGKASLEFNKKDMTVRLIFTAPFEKIANFISMEFLTSGTLGKLTLLDFISMAASSFVTTAMKDCSCDNNDMYV